MSSSFETKYLEHFQIYLITLVGIRKKLHTYLLKKLCKISQNGSEIPSDFLPNIALEFLLSLELASVNDT